MDVTNHFKGKPAETQVQVEYVSAGEISPSLAAFNSEHCLELYAEGRLLHRFLCSPADLGELCTGWLHSEGYGGAALEISADGRKATIVGAAELPVPPESLPAGRAAASVKEMLVLFTAASEGYARTHGIHACVIQGEGWSICRTDIGRHNAIDKAIGGALLAGYDLRGATLFTSGRINTQTVEKVARCSLGCLMSKATITEEALARSQTLNLPTYFSVKESGYFTNYKL